MLTAEEKKHLARVIGEMEKNTSGEIRLMIVRHSTPLHLLPAVLWLGLSVLALIGLLTYRELSWGAHTPLDIPILVLVSAAVGFALAKWPPMVRLLMGRKQMQASVWARAQLEFLRQGLCETADRTGILIFLSRLERKAIVLADKGIAKRLPQETWNEVVQAALSGSASGEWSKGLEKAIRQCGALLAQHFPPAQENRNELPNAVIVEA